MMVMGMLLLLMVYMTLMVMVGMMLMLMVGMSLMVGMATNRNQIMITLGRDSDCDSDSGCDKKDTVSMLWMIRCFWMW